MLDDRKLRVLYAIIDSHILTAEPIGSRTISKQYDLGVSSATIRNEMSDLEEQGYLNKPHSSAGRVPSNKAYRLYVDEILRLRNSKDTIDFEKKNKMKEILINESWELDQLIQNSAKVLSTLTSYTALAISPQAKQSKLKHIQLTLIDDREILMVIVNNSGMVKNTIIRLHKDIPKEEILILSNFINNKFKGLSLSEMRLLVETGVLDEMKVHSEILEYIVPIVLQSLKEIEDIELYSDGVTKILNFPEYKDLNKAKDFISFIENKDLVVDLLLNGSLKSDIEIFIGDELEYQPIKECSLISSTYRIGDTTIGKVGIIGPTRMDYLKLIDTLEMFSVNITEIIDKLF